MAKQKLSNYKKKRDFKQTPEPSGNKGKRHQQPIFVIQRHDATNLHYDFRLEIDGVLKSWAVPKGIPKTTKDRHLAIETEGHPLEYADFEGEIPEGQYGAGKVKIWDRGRFENIKEKDGKQVPLKSSYHAGQIEVWLKGNKLDRPFALIKTKFGKNKGKDNQWLLIRMKKRKR